MVNREGQKGQLSPADLNVAPLAQLSWEELTPAQWKERMEDMRWILNVHRFAGDD